MSHLKHALIVVMGLLLMAGVGWAQVNRGTITGIVTDPSGAVVPGVALTITNTATGVTNNLSTTTAGVYTVPNLIPGTYSVTAVKTGFKKYIRSNIEVPVGETVSVNIALAVGTATQSVQVTATAPLLKRETSDTGTTISSRMVEQLPLTSFGTQRTPATFMQLAPGVTGRGNSAGAANTSRTMSTSISGSMVSSTVLMLDGADIPTLNEFEGDLRALQIPPDAIQEFKLEATNAPANYGRTGGGAASFEVKSGTNQFHGTAYEYLRNDKLNARNFFQSNVTPYKQNEFGVTGGGPIIKNKAFLFGWYDGFRLSQGVSTGLASVPTSEMLAGNFQHFTDSNSSTGNVIPIYDPTTHTTCGPEICDNIVNPNYFSVESKKVLPYFPTPSAQYANDPYRVVNNYTNSVVNPDHINEWGLKGDYSINEKNRLSVLWDYGKNTTPNYPLIPAPLGGGDQPSENLTKNARINWNLIIRPNLVNQATLSWDLWNIETPAVSTWAGKSDWVSYMGLKNVNPLYPTQFPYIGMSGYQNYNGGGGVGIHNDHDVGFNDSLSWIHGKHTVQFGFEWLKAHFSGYSSGNSAGQYLFFPYETALAGSTTPGSGIAFASFLLGLCDQCAAYHITAPSYAMNGYYAGFVQDDYKVTKKLTVNLGFRYDLFIPDYSQYNQKSWISPIALNPGAIANGTPLVGALAHATPLNNSGLITYKKNFSPRIGLAYALNNKTVIRTAYGIYYAQGNANRLTGAFNLGYNGTVSTNSANGGITPGLNWDTQGPPTFTPSLNPALFNGTGSAVASYGALILQDPTDSLPPYMQNWLFQIQRQLPGQMVLSVGYVGNHGTHLSSRVMPWDKMPPQYLQLGYDMIPTPTTANPSATTSALLLPISNPAVQALPVVQAMPVDPNTGDHSPYTGFQAQLGSQAELGQALRTMPQYTGWSRYYEGVGISNYNALQVKLEKHFSHNLSLLVSYAWSKTLTDGGNIFSTFSTEFATTTPWNARAQYCYSFEDIPQLASIAYVYRLPVGKGQRFMNHGGVLNQILGGWSLSGIQQYQSGLGMNIDTVGIPNGLEDNGWQNVSQVLGVPMASQAYASGHFDPNVDSLLNPAAFTVHPTWGFGTLAPTEGTVRMPGYMNEDWSLMKDWKIKERWDLNFHADFFNAFNRTVFGDNQGSYAYEPYFTPPNGGAGFGTITSQSNQPRVIQFGLKLSW